MNQMYPLEYDQIVLMKKRKIFWWPEDITLWQIEKRVKLSNISDKY
jgi:hypothetical protein